MKIDSILVPVDFSPASEAALARAIAFGTRFEARIRLLHIVEDPVFMTPYPGVGVAEGPGEREAHRQRVGEELQRLAERAAAASLPADSVVTSGYPAGEILEHAKDADLVVMSTHGRTGLSHALLGSVAEKVIRTAPCPVFSFRSTTPPDTIRRVLYLCDLSSPSLAAVDFAATLLDPEGTIEFLTILDGPAFYPPVHWEHIAEETHRQVIRTRTEQSLRQLVDESLPKTVPSEVTVKEGHAYREIMRCVESSSPDLIVMTTHGRSGWKHALLGSVAEKVVRTSPCPVLTFHPHRDAGTETAHRGSEASGER